jgi:hypothetical protein
VILLACLLIPQSTTRVWAIEEAVHALAKYTAVHITGYTTINGAPALAEIWARANAAATRSEKCVVKSDPFVAWVSDNKTFIYDRAQNTVIIDPAVTVGLNPWIGPNFLKTLAKLPDCRTVVGDDLATGQKRLILTASLESSAGPQSFYIEFDGNTKLPVSMKHWSNRERRGAPDFSLEKIIYFESLPDSTFAFVAPTSARFTAKPLTIPEANLRLLSDPKSGIAAAGLTRDEACQTILTQLWSAVIDGDLARLRQLCPITASWPDALLRELGAQDDPVELLQVGAIEQEGQSPLGPLVLVPSQVRCRDGKVREVKMVVQFRQTDKGVFCVLNGSYGYSVEVEEP